MPGPSLFAAVRYFKNKAELLMQKIICAVALAHLVLMSFSVIPSSVGCWGLIVQYPYYIIGKDIQGTKFRSPIFIAAFGNGALDCILVCFLD